METGSTAAPAARSGDTGVLTVEDEQFENLLDEQFIIINMIDGRMVAEIIRSSDPGITQSRIQKALDVGYLNGQHSWARVEGDYAELGYNVVTIHFMPDGDL